MKKNILPISLLFMCCLFHFSLQAQGVSNKEFDSLRNPRSVYFVNEKGYHFGCGMNLECMPLKVQMYFVAFDKKSKKIVICGSVYLGDTSKDTVTIGGVSILTAQPMQDTLKEVRVVGRTVERLGETIFPYRRGDFRIEFVPRQNEKLYFSHPIFTLVEYDFDKLILGESLRN